MSTKPSLSLSVNTVCLSQAVPPFTESRELLAVSGLWGAFSATTTNIQGLSFIDQNQVIVWPSRINHWGLGDVIQLSCCPLTLYTITLENNELGFNYILTPGAGGSVYNSVSWLSSVNSAKKGKRIIPPRKSTWYLKKIISGWHFFQNKNSISSADKRR